MFKTTISRLLILLFGCVASFSPATAQRQTDAVRHCLNMMETLQFDRLAKGIYIINGQKVIIK